MTAPSLRTCLWFDSQAEPAATLYVSLFEDAKITHVQRNHGSDSAFIVQWEMMGQKFTGLNGGPHYTLTPAASIEVHVDTQAEVDRLWDALLADGGVEQRCGWLADRFGVSWQIIPRRLIELMKGPQGAAVGQAMMKMIKLDIAGLEAAAKA